MCIIMSDVRLSNASPTLERVDARQPDSLRPSVRRSLFGRPDPGDIQRNLDAVVQEGVQAFRQRYNFDPVSDTPLPGAGNYAWQEDLNPPEFYARPPHRSAQPPRGEEDSGGRSQREDAGERNHQAPAERSRKRRSGDLGPCSSDTERKRSHNHEDDDSDDGEGQALAVERQEGTSSSSSSTSSCCTQAQ